MQFELISYQSDWYTEACQLRNKTLRKPLGLDLMIEDLAAESEYLHYGMIVSNRVIACALAIPVSEIKMKIRQMTVAPEYQCQGTGRALLQNMEVDLKQRGVAHLELDARVTAVGFYEKLGYAAVGEEFVSVSIPHLRMVKSLI
ncbi:MAG: GNAT family N-acetyltransferase [Gimesia sp.]|nr:GNAT family N-acetyltransferase [Gimesia sp.]